MKKTMRSLLLVVVAAAFVPIGALAAELKIMVVFSHGASQTVNVADTFVDIRNYVQAKFSQAQLTAPTFVQYPTFTTFLSRD